MHSLGRFYVTRPYHHIVLTYHHIIISPYHHTTISPYHLINVSPFHYITISLYHSITVSPYHILPYHHIIYRRITISPNIASYMYICGKRHWCGDQEILSLVDPACDLQLERQAPCPLVLDAGLGTMLH